MSASELTIPFYQFEIKDWENKKKQLLEVYSRVKNNLVTDDPISFVYTDFRQKNYDSNYDYVEDITEILDDEISQFSIESDIENLSISCWFQKYTQGCFHAPHNHGAIGYSCVCYIEYDEDEHKPTVFILPFSNPKDGTLIQYFPQNIKEGTIIFFPSSMTHYVLPNESKKIRIILSMNLKPQSMQ